MPQTLVHRLFLDAQDEFRAAIEHVPNPGRGGSIGSLNPSAWTVAHVAAMQDVWLNGACGAGSLDAPTQEWFAQAYSGPAAETAPTFEEAVTAFEGISASTSDWVAATAWDDLLKTATLPEGAPAAWHGVSKAYLVLRAIAHLYVHAGELSVLAALMAAGDLGLPGRLTRSSSPGTAEDPSVGAVAALVRDGAAEVRRAAEVTPQPAATGAMDRLNPVSHTLVHLAAREDRYWAVEALGLAPSPRVAALQALDPGGAALAVPWPAALAAFEEVEARSSDWLAGVDGTAAAAPSRNGSSVGSQLARSAAHLFAHAGEMMAHASLYGAADIGQPGPLMHTREATPPR